MAKTLSINVDEVYESRAGTMTVREACKWLDENTGSEDEESGEVTGSMTPGQAICYAVRRMQALAKDNARFTKGKAPERIYTPRVAVEGARKNAPEVKEAARVALANALHVAVTPHGAPRSAPKVAPGSIREAKLKANAARIAAIEAELAARTAKPAKPAPVAKPPRVVKAAKREDNAAPVVGPSMTVEEAYAFLMS